MATWTEPSDEPARSDLLVNAGLTLILTVIVVGSWWGFAVPSLPETGTLAAAVAVGLIGGGALHLADELGYLRPFQENAAVFVVVVVATLAVGFTLFPDGLPVAAEIGLLALLWGSFAARLALYLTASSGPSTSA